MQLSTTTASSLFAAFLCLACPLSVKGQVCFEFELPTSFPVGDTPISIATTDFNEDGNVDVAVANHDSNDVSVLLGDGQGAFANALSFSVGHSPRSITAADFNGDGHVDLAVASWGDVPGIDVVSVLLGDGSGGLATPVSFLVAGLLIAITAADFNEDGHVDLAVTNWLASPGNDVVSVLLGDGSGGFASAVDFPVGSNSPYAVIAADFDEDGHLDLATANAFNSNDVSVLLGDGSGGFASPAIFPAGNPYSITAADFNEDGHLDLATANYGFGDVSVLLGDGSGEFASAASFPAGTLPLSVTAADFDEDGHVDIAVVGWADATVLFGDGQGSFGASASFFAGNDPESLVSADLNEDDHIDLVVANWAGDDISVLLGDGLRGLGSAPSYPTGDERPESIIAADFNEDGHDDLAVAGGLFSSSISVLLADGEGAFESPMNHVASSGDANPRSLVAADFDDDGHLDIAVASSNYPENDVSVLLGDGLGGFESAPSYLTGGRGPVSITAADFNEDGDLDLAVANRGVLIFGTLMDDSVSLLLGNGLGGFADPQILTPEGSGSITSADLNEDGHMDLAVAQGDVSVLLGDGMGGFGDPVSHPAEGSEGTITTGDFNEDGHVDLAVAAGVALYNGCYPLGQNIVVLLGDGLGGFGDPTGYPAHDGPAGPVALTTADFDEDGHIDLAVANGRCGTFTQAGVSVLLGDGQGVFSSPVILPPELSTTSVTARDFEGDGHIDLAVTSGAVRILPAATANCTHHFVRGDSNADGDLNTLADGVFLLQFGFLGGAAPLCDDAADVDDDGTINPLADAVYLLVFGFVQGSPPPAPFPECGEDPTDDGLSCLLAACP